MKSLFATLLLVAAVRADWVWDEWLGDWVDDSATSWSSWEDGSYDSWDYDWSNWGSNEGPLELSATSNPPDYKVPSGAAYDPFDSKIPKGTTTSKTISLEFLLPGTSTSKVALVPVVNGTTSLICGSATNTVSYRRVALTYVVKPATDPPALNWIIKRHPNIANTNYYQILYNFIPGSNATDGVRTLLGAAPTQPVCLTIATTAGSATVPTNYFNSAKCQTQFKYAQRKKVAGVMVPFGNYMVTLSTACSTGLLTAWQVAGLCDGPTDASYLTNCPVGSTDGSRIPGSFALAPVNTGPRNYIGVNKNFTPFKDYTNALNPHSVPYLMSSYHVVRNVTTNLQTGQPQEPTTNAIWRYRNVAFKIPAM